MLPLEERREVAKSKRELARRLGVSHSAVIKAERDQRISALPDGTYDVAACTAAWVSNTKRTRPSAVTAGELVTSTAARGDLAASAATDAEGVASRLSPSGDATIGVPAEATAIIVETLREAGYAVTGEPTQRQADVAYRILQGMKAKLEVDRIRGRSVDKGRAHDVLTTHAREVRNRLLAWPKTAAPTIARELGIGDHHPLEMALDAHLRTLLEQVASVPPPDDLFPASP